MIEAPDLRDLEGVRHGFFTREGGASIGDYASLNCGLRVGDDPELVWINRARCAARFGLGPERLCTARQVHGRDVLTVTAPWPDSDLPEGDALVTRQPGLLIGVLTADCAPVLLADPEARVVGAVHAGWRGALCGVLEATVEAMLAEGADRARIRAAVGPCIAQGSYEVGPELYERFVKADPGSEGQFVPLSGTDRLLLDLKGYVLRRLRRAGIEHARALALDTFSERERFFSYRRTTKQGGGRFGLQLSAIAHSR